MIETMTELTLKEVTLRSELTQNLLVYLIENYDPELGPQILREKSDELKKKSGIEISSKDNQIKLSGGETSDQATILSELFSSILSAYERRFKSDDVWSGLQYPMMEFYKSNWMDIRKTGVEYPIFKHNARHMSFEKLLDLFSVKTVIGKEWTPGIVSVTSENLIFPSKKMEIRIPIKSINVPLKKIISYNREVYLSVDTKNLIDALWVLDYKNQKNQLCSILVTESTKVLDLFKNNVSWIRKEIGRLMPQEQAVLTLLNNHLPESTILHAINVSQDEFKAMLTRLLELNYINDRNQITAEGLNHIDDKLGMI
ncbi:MAG: hypothetical protein ABH950_09195 [Candidatus Altiarchaeota archaeon]